MKSATMTKMLNGHSLKETISGKSVQLFLSLCMLFSFSTLFAQQTEISASIDSTQIKIGEQIKYIIKVETDSANTVVFPEAKSFSPMEVVASLATDTLRKKSRFQLLKEYALTQFDSGKYIIPKQNILVNNQPFFTDSMQVVVNDVVVDTTKQKMFPIKPSLAVPQQFTIPNWVWWLLGALVLLGLIVFLLIRKKKNKEKEEELPPYEQAMLELDRLDHSKFLENREVKAYYSELTGAIRKYLDRKVYDRAMESTTSELIAYLELQRDAGKLKLDKKTIKNLQLILQRADLAKFANSRPDIITAKDDRGKVKLIINDVKTSVPEPTEEELMRDEAYREAQAGRNKRKKIIIGAIAVASILVILAVVLISTKGFTYMKDSVFGTPTKELLEGDWISSEYGNPPVSITTPEVLTRTELNLPKQTKRMMLGSESFTSGSMESDFYVLLTTVQLSQGSEFDLDKAVEGIYTSLEAKGATNIVMKKEKFNTINGAQGIKAFGTLEVENPVTKQEEQHQYIILNFAENGGFEQVSLVFNTEDTYAKELSQRVVNSVELKKTEP